MDMGMPKEPQPYTKNYRQLKNAEKNRNSLPKGKAHQLNIKWSALKTDAYSLSSLYLYI